MMIVRRSVLLVEDDAFLRFNLAEALTAAGFAVLEAQNATEALGVIRERDALLEFLITDYQLGEISGIHVAFEFRFQNPLRPIVFMTGHDLPPDVRRMSDVRYLRKPFTHGDLLHAMTAPAAGSLSN